VNTVAKSNTLIFFVFVRVLSWTTEVLRFIWTKSARDILQKVIRANCRLSSKQNAALH
jgi:hypothetical protein